MGAGILPVAIVNNKLHFLFGKESKYDDTQGYSDFGGGTDPGETPLQTAIREGGEELHGFIGNKAEIRGHLKKNKYFKLTFDRYHVFMILIDYDVNLPIYYNNHYDFLSKHLPDDLLRTIIFDHHVFEKQRVMWFNEKELVSKKHLFRKFYRPFLKTYLSEKRDIIRFFKKGKKYNYTKRNQKTSKKRNTKKNRNTNKKKTRKRN
jgi:hypothetical protein